MTKERIIDALQARAGEFVSGGALAEALGLSRTAVWKAVEQLRQEGYPIESQPRRGHRLLLTHDVLSEAGIRRYLDQEELQLQVYPTITSTNTVLKQMALEEAPAGLALVAGEQTAGRGRLGRSFYSPSGSGLYLSLLLRPGTAAAEATCLTACAAVSVAEAIESLAEVHPGIKWVNDLLIGGKKVCGILTEAGLDLENGAVSYVIIGIGINTRLPAGDFPEELRAIAGAVFGEAPIPDLRNRLAAQVLDRLWRYSQDPAAPELFEKYKSRSLALGQPIQILSPGKEPASAQALDLERDYSLRVRLADGSEQLLRSGEISIRL
ncbi:MAG: biotin--[Clostridia bacterium]|nr:biotin--[acetyl-CoA-carboxylase] ligase [Clostridia bacterium]